MELNMMKTIEIGDLVGITDPGYQYTSYTEKAIELKADVSDYVRKTHANGTRVNHRIAQEDRSCGWIYNDECEKGDICIVLNMSSSQHVLIQRIHDGRQFLMDSSGLKIHKKSEMFNDEDFLL